MNVFCHMCGTSLPAGSKFCNKCGVSLASLAAPIPKQPRPVQEFAPFSPNEDDDGDEYIDRLPHANIRQNQLHVTFAKENHRRETIGDTILQGPVSAEEQEYRRGGINPNTYMDEFKKEAGAIRPK